MPLLVFAAIRFDPSSSHYLCTRCFVLSRHRRTIGLHRETMALFWLSGNRFGSRRQSSFVLSEYVGTLTPQKGHCRSSLSRTRLHLMQMRPRILGVCLFFDLLRDILFATCLSLEAVSTASRAHFCSSFNTFAPIWLRVSLTLWSRVAFRSPS